jgi:rod shape-determining protein MreC
VKSIIDDNAYVSGMVLGSGSICTVEGDLKLMDEGMIHVSNFKADSNVLNGDKIVTSNISSKYLEGILIGYAKDVSVDGNQMTMSGYIVPVVDFEHLQEVLVITKKKSDATSDD